MSMRKRLKEKKGYTLVEMIVVLVIITIIAGLAIGGLISYQRYAEFKKNNEYAKTIFTTAQSSMTYAQTGGQAQELVAAIDQLNDSQNASHKEELGLQQLSTGDIENGPDIDYTKEQVYSFIFKKGESKDYQTTGTNAYQKAKKLIYDMVSPYVYDQSILDGTYAIEFDAQKGTIIGVCYMQKADDFTYNGSSESNGTVGIQDREYSIRRELLLGYYGAKDVATLPDGGVTPEVENVELVNEDRLYTRWYLPEDEATNAQRYILQLCDAADTTKVYAELTIDGNQLKIPGTDSTATGLAECTGVKITQYKTDGTVSATGTADLTFPAWLEKDTTLKQNVMCVAWDSIDLQAATVTKNGLSASALDTLWNKNTGAYESVYKDTFSIRRLGIGVQQLKSTVQVVSNGSGNSDQKVSDEEENSYFSKAVSETQPVENTYEISNARHLFNIRYTEKENNASQIAAITTNYKQTEDINWADTTQDQNVVYDNSQINNDDKRVDLSGTDANADSTCAFPAITQLSEKSTYDASYSNNTLKHTISNLILYDKSKTTTTSNGEVTTLASPVGLFEKNAGTIQYLEIAGVRATGEEYVGAVCGYNKGKLENITVSKPEPSEEKTSTYDTISGTNYVGGITGADGSGVEEIFGDVTSIPNSTTRTYEKLTNEVAVSGNSYVGGILGYIYGAVYNENGNGNGNAANSTVAINHCNNYGFVSGSDSYIGGIVGCAIRANLTDLNSYPSKKTNQDITEESLTGSYAGGIAGLYCNTENKNSNADKKQGTVSNCNITIPADQDTAVGYITGNNYVGGLFGVYVTDEIDGKKVASIAAGYTNAALVLGKNYVGGFAGAVAGKAVIDKSNNSDNLTKTMGTDTPAFKEELNNSQNTTRFTLSGFTNQGAVIATDSYAGGVLGFNAGTIQNCKTNLKPNDKDVTNLTQMKAAADDFAKAITTSTTATESKKLGDYAGGIAGGNTGTIKECSFVNGLLYADSYIGGITGKNSSTASVSNCELQNSNLITTGKYVGGLIGQNDGSLTSTAGGNAVANCEIQGADYVGGFVGSQNSGNIAGLSNATTVTVTATALRGHAGGIAGHVNTGATLTDCVNKAELVTAKGKTGYAGGIAGQNEGTISGGKNSAKVSGKGYVGGVAGENTGIITGVSVTSDDGGATTGEAGGSLFLGAIAGYNNGTIQNSRVGTDDKVYEIPTTIKNGTYGGVAGENGPEGTINGGAETAQTTAYINLGSDKGRIAANLGGITGLNKGTINNYTYQGELYGSGGSRIGYGGIAGRNEGTIRDCHNNSGDINVNYSGCVGGIVGYNTGIVTGSSLTGEGELFTNKGHIGGIVGYNIADNTGSGLVTNCNTGTSKTDEDKWTISGTYYQSDDGTGGIIGYNSSDQIVSGCNNYAKVMGRQSGDVTGVAGIIGRNEITKSSAFKMTECNNYGTITNWTNGKTTNGATGTGGMVGRWKYKGGTIQECNNYGLVTTNKKDAGGVVGDIYALSKGSVLTIDNCKNYGTISGQNGAGILGGADAIVASNISLRVNNCVNLGIAKDGGTGNAGIVANSSSANYKTYITNCKNYGVSATMRGIYASGASSSNLIISNCFGVVSTTDKIAVPITNSSINAASGDNYYFYEKAEEENPDNYYIGGVALGNGTKSGNGTEASLFDGDYVEASRYVWQRTSSNTSSSMIIDCRKGNTNSLNLSSLQLHWWSASDVAYQYKLTAITTDGKEEQILPSDTSENATDSGDGVITSGGTSDVAKAEAMVADIQLETPISDCNQIRIDVISRSDNSNYRSIWEIGINGDQPVYDATDGAPTLGRGVALKVTQSDTETGKYDAWSQVKKVGINGLAKNPLTITADTVQAMYDAIKDQLVISKTGAMNNPNPKMTENGDGYNLTWTASPGAIEYRVAFTVDGVTTDYIVVGNPEIFIPKDDKWSEKTASITVTAVASDTSNNEVGSIQSYSFGEFLTRPSAYLLLDGPASEGGYISVVDNASAYSGKEADIVMTVMDGKETILQYAASAGQSENTYAGGTASIQVSTYAQSNEDSVKNSSSVSFQSRANSKAYLKSTALASTKNSGTVANTGTRLGFSDTMDEYNLQLQGNGTGITMRGEFLQTDDTLGVPVVISKDDTYLTLSNSDVITLKDLPKFDDNEIVTVRTIPWSAQGDVARYYRTVATDQTLEQLESLPIPSYDVESEPATETGGATTATVLADLKKAEETKNDATAYYSGYEIEKNTDNEGNTTYDVYYSAILKYPDEANYKKQIWQQPYDGSGAVVAAQSQTKVFSFFSSEKQAETLPEYQPTPVLAEDYEEADGSYTFSWEDKENQGPYEVTLTGLTPEGDSQEIYHVDSTKEETLTLDGSDWNYQSISLKVSRLAKRNLMGVLKKAETSTVKDYKMTLYMDSLEAPTITSIDKTNDNFTYKVAFTGLKDKLQKKDLSGYRIDLYRGKNTKVSSKTVGVDDDYAKFDLEKYAGETVSATVTAIAKKDAAIYSSSRSSKKDKIKVPVRAITPQKSDISFEESCDKKHAMTTDAFKGTGIHVLVKNADAKASRSYALQATLYSDKALTNAVKSYETKTMDGDQKSASYNINNLKIAYAGYYLMVRVKAFEDGKVNSQWSDWKIMQIPAVQLDVPDVSESMTLNNETTINWSQDERVKSYIVNLNKMPEDTTADELQKHKEKEIELLKKDAADYSFKITPQLEDKISFTIKMLTTNEKGEEVYKTVSNDGNTKLVKDEANTKEDKTFYYQYQLETEDGISTTLICTVHQWKDIDDVWQNECSYDFVLPSKEAKGTFWDATVQGIADENSNYADTDRGIWLRETK